MFRKSAKKPVKKIQLMLNESQDCVSSKTMRLFQNDTRKTKKTGKKSRGIHKMRKIKTIKTLLIAAILVTPVLFGLKINEAAQKYKENDNYKTEASADIKAEN